MQFRFPEVQISASDEKSERALVTLDSVAFGYGKSTSTSKSTRLFSDVSLQVRVQAKVALMGRNGAGKSSLLRLLMQEDNFSPQRGSVVVDAARGGDHFVAYFSQNQLQTLEDHLDKTCATFLLEKLNEDWESGAAQRAAVSNSASVSSSSSSRGAKSKSPTLLDARKRLGQFGLCGKLALQKIASLSGGQRTRLLFVVAVRRDPKLLILDEPTNSLDLQTTAALGEGLRKYTGAVLVVSHNQNFLASFCNEAWFLDDGKIRAEPFVNIESGGDADADEEEALRQDWFQALFEGYRKKLCGTAAAAGAAVVRKNQSGAK